MKGTVLELVLIFVILGITMMGLLFGLRIYNEFVDSGAWPTNTVGNATRTGARATLDVINYGMIFLMGGLIASLVISAFFIKVHPIFFVVSVITLIIVVMVSAPVSNAFMSVATSDSLSTETNTFPLSAHVIGNFPIIAAVGGMLILIALYAKPSGGGV